ncbi:MAG TPA: SDR family oxidoreductase [Polyangiaceae bacterium]|jgi:NADP-dependent 3-hydroxy acid dehydrogenase YdfG
MGAVEWKSQVVVVTGASAGIGAALAREVGKRGGSVVLAARRPDRLDEVARSTGATYLSVPTDVTRRDDVTRLAAAAIERFGHVDVWVNNAGRGITRPLLQLTDEDVDAMVRDNVKSALYGMQAIVPHFKQRKRGHLLNVSSMLGRVPFAGFRSAYCASKAALQSLTEILRADLASAFPDIVVGTVVPGVVTTEFGLNALHGGVDSRTLPNSQSAEEVAAVIADAIASRRGGDVYTRPEAVDRVLGYLRGLATGA